MVGRPIYKAVIDLEDTPVPVKFYSAIRKERVSFRLLHGKDRQPLVQKMYCSKEDKPVDPEERALGYEATRGQFVVLDPEEVREAQPESGREIGIAQFVDEAEIDPRLYDRPYYLGPDGEENRYALLVRALDEAGRAAICQWVMRRKSYVGVLRAADGILELVTMRYAHEVVPADELEIKHPRVKKKELETAVTLIGEMSAEFDPSAYRNEHQQNLMHFIEKKAKGEEPETKRPKRKKPTTPSKLQETLEKSLEKAKAA